MDEPPSDPRHFVVDGRKWRATDPGIPEPLRIELVAELMDARRAVKGARDDATAMAAARSRVQDAKVALGERGEPWWDPPSEPGRRERLAATMRALLRHRDPDKTICPSDAARVVGGSDWRPAMELARAVAYALSDDDVLEVRQQGARVDGRTATGRSGSPADRPGRERSDVWKAGASGSTFTSIRTSQLPESSRASDASDCWSARSRARSMRRWVTEVAGVILSVAKKHRKEWNFGRPASATGTVRTDRARATH